MKPLSILDQAAAIRLEAYHYTLPEDRIAKFPLAQRDQAKLLHYHQGQINHRQFFELPGLLPEGSLLVFNDTKVIPARLHFQRATGALVEVFLIEPQVPHLVQMAMQAHSVCTWYCLVGNKKRWKEGEILSQTWSIEGKQVVLSVAWEDRTQDWVKFTWDAENLAFVDILKHFGEIPLPPYLKRETTEQDKEQYQTVYSKNEGAVAAPTAGLHFTDQVIGNLAQKGVERLFLTLHVSGGTFQPIKVDNVVAHPMHSEQMIFKKAHIEHLIRKLDQIIAVGTTSMRALESLYWFGVALWQHQKTTGSLPPVMPFMVKKLAPYQTELAQQPPVEQVLETISAYMTLHGLEELMGETEIFIFPGYQFKLCRGLITNYHLPSTTLILLVAAFIGEDWRKVYEAALANQYRFLSYGDSSLLMP